jgi:nicotinamidase-related amidase
MSLTHLLVIDPQNDFIDQDGAALPVPGARADMERVAALIDGARGRIDDITITLDSHHSVGIERPAMWRTEGGEPVAPFTEITATDVRAGKYAPVQASHLGRVLAYLDALEQSGRYKLMVWPVHCETGTWGHNVYAPLREAYNRWEAVHLQPVRKVFKGMNAWTENYSALRAEVPDPQDPGTELNTDLIATLDLADRIVIAGEASSHCVRATTEHISGHLPSGAMEKLVLLSDAMSPVPGFADSARDFLESMRQRGAIVCTSAALLDSLA